jgi:hypothetical protein
VNFSLLTVTAPNGSTATVDYAYDLAGKIKQVSDWDIRIRL